MIRLSWMGQFGNQLFQYCFAKILAKQYGMALKIDKPYWVNNSGGKLKPQLFPVKQEKGRVEGIIRLRGFFQVYQYYKPHKSVIKEWFTLPQLPEVPKDVLCVHVRRKTNNIRTTFKEFQMCIGRAKEWNKIWVITDTPDRFTYKFKKYYKARIVSNNFAKDFLTLASARQVVMSYQSTFSWWATWLGNCENIFVSVPSEKALRNQRLIVDDEPRFHYVRFKNFL